MRENLKNGCEIQSAHSPPISVSTCFYSKTFSIFNWTNCCPEFPASHKAQCGHRSHSVLWGLSVCHSWAILALPLAAAEMQIPRKPSWAIRTTATPWMAESESLESESLTVWSQAAIPIWDFQLTENSICWSRSYYGILSHCIKCIHSLIKGVWKPMLRRSILVKTEDSLVFFNLPLMLLFNPVSYSGVLNAGTTTPHPPTTTKKPRSQFYYLSGRSVF